MKLFVASLLLTLFTLPTFSQIQLKTEYIGSAKYRNTDGTKTEGKGGAMISSAFAQIPLSVKINENNRPTLWAVGMGGSYTSFNNKRIDRSKMPHEITNLQLGLTHLRPLSDKLSLMLAVGAGSYTSHAKLNDVRMTNILVSGSSLLIWHLKPNLSLGGGLAINTSFGYPMVFPAFYLQWKLQGRYEVDVQLVNAVEVSAGIKLSDKMKLKLVGSMSGALALEKIDGKKKMFMHQYMIVGLQPEFTFGKINIPITLGANVMRMAKYEDRTLKAMFKSDKGEHDNFGFSPYGAIAINYNF